MNEIDFKDSLITIGLSDVLQNDMIEWYSSHRQTVREVLTKMDNKSSGSLRYSNIEWRFQSQIASQSLRDQLKPSILLKLELSDGTDHKKYVTLECDVSNLFHIHDVLEEALCESRSQHLFKIVRHIK